ncbi:MAG TPA: hypothetical protein VJ777_26430 [Mycobacterium sp.]|nr:hypothetical protein [Mycobacterium sp.]
MHRTIRATVLSAVAIAAALGLSGCGGDDNSGQPAAVESPPPITKPPAAPVSPPPAIDPLPPPTALTDVMARLADVNVPGADKVALVEYATADDAAALDRFGRALRDGGFTPLTFEATDLTWSQAHPGNVVANIIIKTANRQAGGDFTFPMEFSPTHGSWQVTRQTADMLLQLGQEPTATPPR